MSKLFSTSLSLYLVFALLFSPVPLHANTIPQKPKSKFLEAQKIISSSASLIDGNTTFNDCINLLSTVENGDLEGRVTQEQFNEIVRFLIFTAKLGVFKGITDEEALEKDSQRLVAALEEDFEYEPPQPYEQSADLAFVYGYPNNNYSVELCGVLGDLKKLGKGAVKGVRETGRFIRRNKNEITLGVAIAISTAVVGGFIYAAATTIGGTTAAASLGSTAGGAVLSQLAQEDDSQEFRDQQRSPQPKTLEKNNQLYEHIDKAKEEIIESGALNSEGSEIVEKAREAGSRLAHEMVENAREEAGLLPPSEATAAEEEQVWSELHDKVEMVFNEELTKECRFDRGEDYTVEPVFLPLVVPAGEAAAAAAAAAGAGARMDLDKRPRAIIQKESEEQLKVLFPAYGLAKSALDTAQLPKGDVEYAQTNPTLRIPVPVDSIKPLGNVAPESPKNTWATTFSDGISYVKSSVEGLFYGSEGTQLFETREAEKDGAPAPPIRDSGKKHDRGGLSRAGRAQQKHGDRQGGILPKPTGTIEEVNQQGQKTLEDILDHPEAQHVSNRRGGTDVKIPNGPGARFDADGNFDTFLEP